MFRKKIFKIKYISCRFNFQCDMGRVQNESSSYILNSRQFLWVFFLVLLINNIVEFKNQFQLQDDFECYILLEKLGKKEEEKKSIYLNYMVPKIHFFSLLSGSVLNIEYTNEVSSPAPHQPIKQLESDSRCHPQL